MISPATKQALESIQDACCLEEALLLLRTVGMEVRHRSNDTYATGVQNEPLWGAFLGRERLEVSMMSGDMTTCHDITHGEISQFLRMYD